MEIMETAILILILVLCLCLVYVTELMKKMCDRMTWLQDQFNSFKDINAKKWTEYSKEYSEVMELLLAKHNEINELRDQLKLIEDRVEKYKDGICDNLNTVHSQIHAMDCKVKKNEEDTYKIVKDNEKYFGDQVNSLRAINKKLTFAVEENKEMLNKIRTEMSSKEEKEEND